jgi:hypothetical protein
MADAIREVVSRYVQADPKAASALKHVMTAIGLGNKVHTAGYVDCNPTR